MSIFQHGLEIFDKDSADKILSEKDKGIKVSPPMPIRVKTSDNQSLDANSERNLRTACICMLVRIVVQEELYCISAAQHFLD